jgi:hypothetical protein
MPTMVECLFLLHIPIYPCLESCQYLISQKAHRPNVIIPLLMLRVLIANNVDRPVLPPHALAAIAQLLDTAAHLHPPDLLARNLARGWCAVETEVS